VGTLLANVLGCFAVGVLAHFLIDRPSIPHHARLLLVTGFLGGLTTFSTFGLETAVMARGQEWSLAMFNIAANLLLSLAAVGAGWAAARSIWGA
jgi:CrcB protein